jgi:invasion protein IalB
MKGLSVMGSFKLEIRRIISTSINPGVCTALALGAIVFAAPATAQQTAPPQPAAPAQAAPVKKPGAEKINSAWVKLCDDIKGVKGDVCLTHHERFNPNTGRPLISAAIRKIKGQEKEMLLVMVPLGRLLKPGLLFKVDDEEPIKLDYSFCTSVGCVAETQATPEVIAKLKKGTRLDIGTMSLNQKRIGFRVPLAGFSRAYDGPPIDRKVYAQARKEMFQVIRKRQILLAKKAAEAAKKMKDAKGASGNQGAAPEPKKTP